ncbi:GSK3-beta interaction protein [Anopheles nili]|uniref:GSK3-beta interaction protein n=1 Tax=Anopheles nili TaxID=185578 RepID=UPI00237C1577|nr:GSK3-beta interaction protein [Anopheles nili]
MDDSIKKYYAYCDDNIIEWLQEAEAVIQDIIKHVREVCVSKAFPPTRTESYINLTTLEGNRLCLKLNAEGLQIVGQNYDVNSQDCDANVRYETPYALLSDVSPSYVHSFGSCLTDALNRLEQSSQQDQNLSDVE